MVIIFHKSPPKLQNGVTWALGAAAATNSNSSTRGVLFHAGGEFYNLTGLRVPLQEDSGIYGQFE